MLPSRSLAIGRACAMPVSFSWVNKSLTLKQTAEKFGGASVVKRRPFEVSLA